MKKIIYGIALLCMLASQIGCSNENSNSEIVKKEQKENDSINAKMIASYSNVRTNYYNTSGGDGSAGQVCAQILHDGTMRYYNYTSLHDYKKALKKAITLDESQLKTLNDTKSASLGVSLPVLKALANFNGNYDSNHEEYENIRKKYTDNSKLEISDQDLVIVEQQIGDPTIVNAWKECIKTAFNNERG